MPDSQPGLSREHSVEEKWANRALSAEMEVGRLTVRLENNIAGWAAEQKSRELAERKLARAMKGLTNIGNTYGNATGYASDLCKEITAMDNKEPNIAGAVDRVASELIKNAVEEPIRPPLDDLYMGNKESGKEMREDKTQRIVGESEKADERGRAIAEGLGEVMREGFDPSALEQEPEPDHEAARKQASAIADREREIKGDDWNLARSYLALSDELAALKALVEKVPHVTIDGKDCERHAKKHLEYHCIRAGGACIFEFPERADA